MLAVTFSPFLPICDIGQHPMLQWRSRFRPLSKHSFEPIRCRFVSEDGHAAAGISPNYCSFRNAVAAR